MKVEYCPCKDWTLYFSFLIFFFFFKFLCSHSSSRNWELQCFPFLLPKSCHPLRVFATGALWTSLVKLHCKFCTRPSGAVAGIVRLCHPHHGNKQAQLCSESKAMWEMNSWKVVFQKVWVEMLVITLVILRACSAKSTEVWNETDKLSRRFVSCDLVIPFLPCRL